MINYIESIRKALLIMESPFQNSYTTKEKLDHRNVNAFSTIKVSNE